MDKQVGRVEQMETANASNKRSADAKAAGKAASGVCQRELCQVRTPGTFVHEAYRRAP
jgi:hypothetical protein